MVILFHPTHDCTHRFAVLRRKIPGVSERMLMQQLRELEDDGIVHREVYPEVPPKVEYSLTDYGRTLRPITEFMCEWAQRHIRRINAKKRSASADKVTTPSAVRPIKNPQRRLHEPDLNAATSGE